MDQLNLFNFLLSAKYFGKRADTGTVVVGSIAGLASWLCEKRHKFIETGTKSESTRDKNNNQSWINVNAEGAGASVCYNVASWGEKGILGIG
jgi:hypothetical protein